MEAGQLPRRPSACRTPRAQDFAPRVLSSTSLHVESKSVQSWGQGLPPLHYGPASPEGATFYSRSHWLGLSCEDFDLVTDYENCCFCKPNPEYYRQILCDFDVDPSACLMVGNDVDEDILAAEKAGVRGFLLTDHVINRQGRSVSCPCGSYEEMLEYLRGL